MHAFSAVRQWVLQYSRKRKVQGMAEETKRPEKHGYWIHTRKENPQSVTGHFILPECKCSSCGFTVSWERERCPHCGAVMDGEHQ